MNTAIGGVQVLDEAGRWVARTTYAITAGHLDPIGIEIRLRPPCRCFEPVTQTLVDEDDEGELSSIEWTHVAEVCACPFPDPWPTDDVLPIPGAGLSLPVLRRVSFSRDIESLRDAFRFTAQNYRGGGRLASVSAQVSAEPARPRVGRKRRDRLAVLRAVELYERGLRLEDIGAEIGYGRAWVKDALAWARRVDPPLLIGRSGRGARGGVMSEDARQELDQLRQHTGG